VLARAAALPVRPRPHVVARLGGEDQLVAVGAEVLREDRAEVALGAAVGRAVVVGQVEVGDDAVERTPEDGPLGLQGVRVAEVVPQPERDRGELEPATPTAAEHGAGVVSGWISEVGHRAILPPAGRSARASYRRASRSGGAGGPGRGSRPR